MFTHKNIMFFENFYQANEFKKLIQSNSHDPEEQIHIFHIVYGNRSVCVLVKFDETHSDEDDITYKDMSILSLDGIFHGAF